MTRTSMSALPVEVGTLVKSYPLNLTVLEYNKKVICGKTSISNFNKGS